MKRPSLDDVRAAAARIDGSVHRTPVLRCQTLDRETGATLFFKSEHLQKTGAFKIRGASNAVLTLDDAAAARGVATHSSGNHAAALALAARRRGVPAYIVMPDNAPRSKRAAVAGYGAEIVPCAANLTARENALAELVERTGARFVPPYNDHRVIAGQGSCALELLDQVSDLDVLVTPVGGGGLLAGCALVAKSLNRGIAVVGAEPERADDACRSLRAGRIIAPDDPATVADGLRTALGDLTFPILQRHVDAVVTVSEAQIVDAMRHVWERMKQLIEPSAAVAVAALRAEPERFRGRRVGLVLSGGNVDVDRLPWRCNDCPVH